MGTRGIAVLIAAGLLAGCGGSSDGGTISQGDYKACTEMYRLGVLLPEKAPELRKVIGTVENDEIRAAGQAYANDPNPDTSRALVKECGDKVPSKP